MFRSSLLVLGVCCGAAAVALSAQDVQPPAAVAAAPQPAPILQSITITGNKDFPERAVREAAHVSIGRPFDVTDARVAARVEDQYHDEGFTFARVTAAFDAAAGALRLSIDGVEFQGVDETLARSFSADFALRAGDVFNSRRARQALDVLLQPSRGAISPGRTHPTTFTDSRDLRGRRGTFDLVDRDGKRILIVGLREPAGRFRLLPDVGEREDWFTPVDGLVPSFGMGIAVFDHERFNHTYVAGHLSYKTAADRAGYSLGFERPLFGRTKVYVGGEFHDLTASDDQWQVSSLEASVDSIAARRNYRDYYRRQGVQINAAVRIHPQIEALFAWRGERETPLATNSDFSFWNSDETFRPNTLARDGRLNAIVIGASVDGRGFEHESLGATYRRHQLETPFGARLDEPDGPQDSAPIWRVDWTSEISSPGAFGSDFDFRRHIVTARARTLLSQHQTFGVLFRFKRASANGDVSMAGTATSYSAVPSPMAMRLELGDGGRITPAERYYVHVIATLGTLADREAEEVGDAVFGRPSETNSLGSLGRLVFRTVLQVSDYLQSISAETKSRKTAGADILKRSAP